MKTRFTILDKRGYVFDEHTIHHLPDDFMITLSIGDNQYVFNKEGRLYVNVINESYWIVKYTNPNVFKGEALYFYTLATDDQHAKSLAFKCDGFINYIYMRKFDICNVIMVKQKTIDTDKLNTVEYFKEDPLL